MRVGREMEETSMHYADRFRGGKDSTKVIVYNIYGSKVGAGGDNVQCTRGGSGTVVGEGRAKVVSAVPVGIPREAVVGTVDC